MAPSVSEVESAMKATLKTHLDDMLRVYKDKSTTNVSRMLTPDATFTLAPATLLKTMGAPPTFSMTNAEREAHFTQQFPALANGDMELLETVVDAPGRKAVAHFRGTVTLVNDASFTLENVFIVHFTDDGTKINKTVEFADAATTLQFIGAVREIAASKGP
ncbi:hypothetical protein B0T24DRAFT_597307 [Lasiosphaeria ovina]|uniref:SnoaL-like domain-containing protein n=1 Tax=Lasiosphaeria ovina TaxID=92902 RepID=A0AAE0JX06_9PEZI|nr:hypothetical protein B0T24DRAFT_597307 [Lasiosphaeria ovina]